ncbi:MAG: hypothetical protein A4S16_11430 [Proteobacteria bacterium SG_bin6]|nr:MAG: hypothetical protein A4S16_11430 [Proteobacteria bacterium SG_bin6]
MCRSDLAPREAGVELASRLDSVIRFYVDPQECERATHELIGPLTNFISPTGQLETCEDVQLRIEFLYCVFGEMRDMGCFLP